MCNNFTLTSYIRYCMLVCLCLCILTSSRILRYDLRRQIPHFRGDFVKLYKQPANFSSLGEDNLGSIPIAPDVQVKGCSLNCTICA
jgi:hypothetical protein